MKLMSELLRSKSVPIVVSHVATESLVTREESLLLAEILSGKHNASGMRCRSRYMQIAGQYVKT